MANHDLTSYDPVRIALPGASVADADVDARIREILEQIPEYERDDAHGLCMRDKAKASVTLRENGAEMHGLDHVELTITVGDGFFPVAFAEGMLGMKAGDRRVFSFEVPALGSSGGDGCVSVMDADIEVREVRRLVQPILCDEWVAAHIPRMGTAARLRETVRGELEGERSRKLADLKRARCSAALGERLIGDPDPEVVDRVASRIREDFERQVIRGEAGGRCGQLARLSDDERERAITAEAARIASEGAAIGLMAEHFGVEASDDEIDRILEASRAGSGASWQAFGELGDRERMRTVAVFEKTLDMVVESAIVLQSSSEGRTARLA